MKINTLVSVIALTTICGCSSEPYEKEIVNYFETKAKVVPIIEEVKIDTTALMESYQGYWVERIEERRAYLMSNIEREYNSAKLDYETDLGYYNKYKKEPWTRMYNDSKRKMERCQAAMDSAHKGVFYDGRYNEMNRLKDDKSKFSQATVKYKLSKDGATLIQKFVIQNDSIVYPTEQGLDMFISFFYKNN